MTGSSDDNLQALQREVQRLLGDCLIRLQQYELLMKAIVAEHDMSGSTRSGNGGQLTPTTDTNGKMLGQLTNILLGSFLTDDEEAGVLQRSPEDGSSSVRVRIHLGLLPDERAQVESDLKEFVRLRNHLVHHFVEQHDLKSLDGCRVAAVALTTASGEITYHFDNLRGWAEDLVRTKQRAAEVFNSDRWRNALIHGEILWPYTVIVIALHEAATELALDGWTPVTKAVEWVSARYPEELPEHYGCRSWQQVLHESGLFELRPRQPGERRATWYRAKVCDSNWH